MAYVYSFPVVKGVQANREYYIAMVPLKMLSKLFPPDEEYVPPEYRAQRKLNAARIPVISKYILQNRDNYVFQHWRLLLMETSHSIPVTFPMSELWKYLWMQNS